MNKRQELIDELIKADQDGTYKTYKSTEEIKAMNNEEIQIIYSNMKNYLSDKRTHKLLKVERYCKLFKSIKGTST
ncbi:MAG: hypothetical protein E7C63_09200 [Finegoldia magna]|uniref:hypothetical protein n=1 Tax=Finegoldia magna TaxID=1260 RepID=UPI00290150F2|nr:hypothetical protein [Finegoldia magna]MDU2640409.1 hypothetical protein [Finegoldia magna]